MDGGTLNTQKSFPLTSSPITIPSHDTFHSNYTSNNKLHANSFTSPSSVEPHSTSLSSVEPHSTSPSSVGLPSTSPSSVGHDRKNRTNSFYDKLVIRVEQPVGGMSISPSSRDIVLAARKGLFIIDLNNPWEPPRGLHHLTKWEVADVQWNPHLAREKWVASTSNQKGLIWNLSLSSDAVEFILHGHKRAISDINWHPFNPDVLATCSVDTYVHLWDLRIPKKPFRSFCAWNSGATQVKFNAKNEHILASSHDRKLMIWDIRKGSLCVTEILAHATKIYGIDWSKSDEKNIITCSLDKKVKFWNIEEPGKCQGEIQTNSPVWQTAVHLWNLENTRYPVESFTEHQDVVKEFVWRIRGGGNQSIDDREFQLITWSKDQNLRLWPISDNQLKLIGHERGKPRSPNINMMLKGYSTFTFRDPPDNHSISLTLNPSTAISTLRVIPGHGGHMNHATTLRPSGASTGGGNLKGYMGAAAGMFRADRFALSPLLWMQGVRMIKTKGEGSNTDVLMNMREEIDQVTNKFKNVKLEKLDVPNRNCRISLHGPWSENGLAFIRVNIFYPEKYPEDRPPIFEIQKTGMISIMNRTHMSQNLKKIAITQISQKRPCLEACVRYLLGGQNSDGQDIYGKDDSDEENLLNSKRRTSYDNNLIMLLGDKDDHNRILFPVICGARFSASGKLVCFFSNFRSQDLSQKSNHSGHNYTYTHPRSYDSWEQYQMITRLPRPIFGYQDGDEDDSLFPIYKQKKDETHDNEIPDANQIPTDHVALFESSDLNKKRHSVISFDLSEMMPVNYKLASKYVLRGNDPVEICKRNAQIAAEHNRPDLEQAWILASLILTQTIPNKRMRNSVTNEDMFYHERSMNPYAKPLVKRKKNRMSYDTSLEEFPNLFAKVNWGHHPLGKNLAQDLINHFINLGDIQMVAMLSCVFREPFPPERKNDLSSSETYFMNSDLLSSSNNDYFNYNNTRYSDKYQMTDFMRSQSSYPGLSTTFGLVMSESYSSSKGSLGTHPYQFENFGYSATPPTPSIYHYGHSEGTRDPIMVPNSGHSIHHQRRSTFGGGAGSGVRDFSSSVSTTASSPKTPRKSSPATAGFTGRHEHFNWPMVYYGNNDKSTELEKKPEKSSGLNLVINMDEFDDERRPLSVKLLDDDRSITASHDQFRLAYCEILYHWGFYEARAEVLKFMSFVKATQIGIHCHKCGTELKHNSTCGNCQRDKYQRKSLMRCSICHHYVKGLMNFCIICKHGGHTSHMREWFALGNEECPTGCGCLYERIEKCELCTLPSNDTNIFDSIHESKIPPTSGHPEIDRIISNSQLKPRFMVCGGQLVVIKNLGRDSTELTAEFLHKLETYINISTSQTNLLEDYEQFQNSDNNERKDENHNVFGDEKKYRSQFIDLETISRVERFEELDVMGRQTLKPIIQS
ncbi:7070_t:CDS:10 [Diversispora eburnea]|uniref:7070_t:CDS:1 n=1 Tax=Diversispora eburnea TaxID=1213867 RepID=A0A9N8UWR3_9GLOM|nr:7070_t:CDS:10 [Diversispora eburnea]